MARRVNTNDEIIDLIFDLSRRVRIDTTFDKDNKHLTMHQLQTMLFISKQSKTRMLDIAQNFSITKPTATVLVNSLVRNGYLERTASKIDKREITINLAFKGRDLLKRAIKFRSAKIKHILSYISDQDRYTLKTILQTILERLKESHEN